MKFKKTFSLICEENEIFDARSFSLHERTVGALCAAYCSNSFYDKSVYRFVKCVIV